MKNQLIPILLLVSFLSNHISYSQFDHRKLKEEINQPLQHNQQSNSSNHRSLAVSDDLGDAPELGWVNSLGGSGYDNVTDVVTDDEGNIFLTGYFAGEIGVSGKSFNAQNRQNGFVAKFSNSGKLVWFTSLPASKNQIVRANGIHVDNSGHVFATGYYTGDVEFSDFELAQFGDETLFYVELDNSGDIISATSYDKIYSVLRGMDIETDSEGNVYVIAATSSTNYAWRVSTAIIKFDTDASELFRVDKGLAFNDLLVVDSKIYLAGTWLGGEIELNEGLVLSNQSIYNYAFVAEMDLDGTFNWASPAEHYVESNANYQGTSQGRQIALNDDGDLILGGYHRGYINFGSDETLNYYGGYVARFETNGDFLGFNDDTFYPQEGRDLAVDEAGKVYILGDDRITRFDGSLASPTQYYLDFNPSVISGKNTNNLILAGAENGLIKIVQLDNNGQFDFETNFEGTTASASVLSIKIDENGNKYTCGYTNNTTSVFGTEVERGFFVSKHNNAMGIEWVQSFPTDPISLDKKIGNKMTLGKGMDAIYVTFPFNGNMELPSGTKLSASSTGSTAILKLNFKGNVKWSTLEPYYNGGTQSSHIQADYDGNVILTGTYSGSQVIGDIELSGSANCFIVKYDQNGDALWVKGIGGESVEYHMLADVDTNGNIYLTGEFQSTEISVNGSILEAPEDSGNLFLAKLDKNGNVKWKKVTAGDQSSSVFDEYYTWPTGIIVDDGGNIFLKGSIGSSIYFDDIHLDNPDYRWNKFLAKFDTNGNVKWAKSIAGFEGTYAHDFNEFDMDQAGNIYFGSQIRGKMKFDETNTYEPSGYIDLFVAKYTSNGGFSWLKSFEGNDSGYNYINSVAVEEEDIVYVGGYFDEELSIDNSMLTSDNINHGFFVALGEVDTSDDDEGSGTITNVSVEHQANFLYPNPVREKLHVKIVDGKYSTYALAVLDISGRVVQLIEPARAADGNFQIDVSNLMNGVYTLKVFDGHDQWIERFIKY